MHLSFKYVVPKIVMDAVRDEVISLFIIIKIMIMNPNLILVEYVPADFQDHFKDDLSIKKKVCKLERNPT